MSSIDLNCDLGESFGNYKCGMDDQVLPLITSANIACGFHASDPMTMKKTVSLVKKYGVHPGAHPGFHDLAGFGRRMMALSPEEITADIEYQIGALEAFCHEQGIRLCHVKPHGALYNLAVKDREAADAICLGIAEADPSLILLAPASSQMAAAAIDHGLKVAREGFADRAYEEDGSLVSRKKPGAMITDPEKAARRVIKMVEKGYVTAITGKEIPMEVDSICIHGDNPAAVSFASHIRSALENEKIKIRSFSA